MPRTFPSQIVALIDGYQPDTAQPQLTVSHLSVGVLTAIVRLIDEIPSELLTMSSENYIDLVCGVEAIKNSVAFWHQKGVGQIGQPGVRGKNALVLIREALAKCPDDMPAIDTTDLLFIEDIQLRDSIRLDLSTATGAFHNGEWKAATVLAGAVAEALLLWAIERSPDFSSYSEKQKGSADTWTFDQYIEAAKNLKLVDEVTLRQAELAKNFRNLIHPGRSKRLGETCDRATALVGLAAAELIIRNLKKLQFQV